MAVVNNKSLGQKIEAIKSRGTKAYILKQKELNPAADADCLSIHRKGDVFCTGKSCFGIGFGMDGILVESDLHAIESFIRNQNKAEYVQLELTPFCDPLSLDLLQRKAYTFSHFLSVWVMDLENWQPKANQPSRQSATIKKVAREDFCDWALTVALGISRDNTVTEELMESTRIFLEIANTAGFLVKENGENAAGGTIAINGRIGELFLTSTVEKYRGRGYQNLLIEERLRYAKAEGCSHATVTTVPGTSSARNMERNGFQLMYNKAVLKSPVIH